DRPALRWGSARVRAGRCGARRAGAFGKGSGSVEIVMRFFINSRSLFAAMLLLCAAPGTGRAQTTGVIEGVVLDPSRTAVEGATVRVTATATSFSQQVRTDRLGYYRSAGLPPGVYRLEASAEGFRTSLHEAAGLSAGRTLKLDFALDIGAIQEAVLVVGAPALVNFSSADWGDTIDQSQLTDLPLNGRDMFDLANQTPGAAFALNH